MNVGYIGLGNMGGALARRLLASRQLRVYDLNADAMGTLASYGAKPAASLAEIADCCDLIFICVPRSLHVRQALFGSGGLAEQLRRGQIVIDQTSGDPAETRSMGEELARMGVHMLDAPVSGGARGALAGTIAIMVGGDAAVLAEARPVLEEISRNITHCGELGTGQIMKMINNTISTCNRFALLEGIALGMKNGLTLATMTKVLNEGGARSKLPKISCHPS